MTAVIFLRGNLMETSVTARKFPYHRLKLFTSTAGSAISTEVSFGFPTGASRFVPASAVLSFLVLMNGIFIIQFSPFRRLIPRA